MWTPKEIRKLLILLTGIGLEIAGVYLLVNQIQTVGNIDISSGLISGKIQSGNAGLLLSFIGLFVMALSIMGGKDIIHLNSSNLNSEETTVTSIKPNQKRGLLVVIIFGIITFSLIIGGIYLEKNGWNGGALLTILGVFCALGEAGLLIDFISSYLNTDFDRDKKDNE